MGWIFLLTLNIKGVSFRKFLFMKITNILSKTIQWFMFFPFLYSLYKLLFVGDIFHANKWCALILLSSTMFIVGIYFSSGKIINTRPIILSFVIYSILCFVIGIMFRGAMEYGNSSFLQLFYALVIGMALTSVFLLRGFMYYFSDSITDLLEPL